MDRDRPEPPPVYASGPDGEPVVQQLGGEFERAVDRLLPDSVRRATVLFSGGLDSSLVATVARRRTQVELLTMGFEGSPDLRAAQTGAESLSLPLTTRVVTDREVRDGLSRWDAEPRLPAGADRSVLLATALALESVDGGLVLCGQGADELFLGYRHFSSLTGPEADRRADADWTHLVAVTWPATVSMATALGLEISSPFLDRTFARCVGALPIELRLPGAQPKGLLRLIARGLGVPPELAGRPKRAMQYGSGIHAALRRIGPRSPRSLSRASPLHRAGPDPMRERQ